MSHNICISDRVKNYAINIIDQLKFYQNGKEEFMLKFNEIYNNMRTDGILSASNPTQYDSVKNDIRRKRDSIIKKSRQSR